MDDWIVSLIFSNWQLSKLLSFFVDYLEAEDEEIGCSKIERFKDKRSGEMRDSNRTLILLKRSLYKKAIEAGLDLPQPKLDFRITEYYLKEKSYPAVGYSSNLYIIIPKTVSVDEINFILREKLKGFKEFNIIKDYTLEIPLESRIVGNHRGFAYLIFEDDVSLEAKAYIKALLNDSFIHIQSSDTLYHLPVFWAKDNKKEDENKGDVEVKSILKREN